MSWLETMRMPHRAEGDRCSPPREVAVESQDGYYSGSFVCSCNVMVAFVDSRRIQRRGVLAVRCYLFSSVKGRQKASHGQEEMRAPASMNASHATSGLASRVSQIYSKDIALEKRSPRPPPSSTTCTTPPTCLCQYPTHPTAAFSSPVIKSIPAPQPPP